METTSPSTWTNEPLSGSECIDIHCSLFLSIYIYVPILSRSRLSSVYDGRIFAVSCPLPVGGLVEVLISKRIESP